MIWPEPESKVNPAQAVLGELAAVDPLYSGVAGQERPPVSNTSWCMWEGKKRIGDDDCDLAVVTSKWPSSDEAD